MLALLLGCTQTVDSGDPLDGAFRVAFIADSHVIGPNYECCSESEGIDNDSIVRTEERLREVVDRINALEPQPELVFILGDVLHHAYHFGDDPQAYRDQDTTWALTQSILANLDAPLHIAWGNHDYGVSCGGDDHVPRETSHLLFEEFFGTAPYHAVDHRGWRFLVMNSQLGPTWERGHALCQTSQASYGAEQLDWVDEQLGEGLPTFTMAHHMLLITEQEEDPEGPNPDLMSVLAKHDNDQLMLVGHTHRWLDYRESDRGAHIVLGATRYDADNFWLVQFEADGETYQILDEDKAGWGTPCADTWRYDLWPSLDPAAPPEDGDCG